MPHHTVLFQPPNHVGLGHISRLIAIALAVKELRPDVRLPFLIEGHGHGLVEAYELPHVSFVSAHDLYASAMWSAWDRSERQRLAFELALALVHGTKPDLLVFDCFPHPSVVQAAIECQVPIVLCLRKSKRMDVYFDVVRSLSSLVRLVLIAHAEGECDVPAAFQSRTCFTGPIVRPAPRASETFQRADDGSKLIVISGGGGGYAGTVDFYNVAIDAFARAKATQPALSGYLVAGPLFNDWSRLRLVNDLRVVPFDPSLAHALSVADLVVCQGGYNTVSEVLSAGVPAICVPAARKADDQFERAELAARQSSRFRMYDGNDPVVLADLMLSAMAAGRAEAPPAPTLTASGASVAARHLIDLLPA